MAGDMRPVFNTLTQWFHERERQRFSSRGDGYWRPLKASTVRRRHGSAVLMNRTGRLYRSLTSRAPGSVVDITSDSLVIGTSVSYAGPHQRRSGGRRLIFNRPTDRKRVKAIITDHILGDA